MRDLHNPFVTKSFLRSVWALDYEAFKDSEEEKALLTRLANWSKRADLKETSAESALLDEFFKKTWGYSESGQKDEAEAFSLYPKFQVKGAGAGGGKGEADAALGHFKKEHPTLVPQVLCEFKDIKSSLDAPQKRKGNTRSPVKQGMDYLAAARRDYMIDDPILPTWAIITDMNEFRLYWADRGHQQYMRFTIQPKDLFQGQGLLGDGEDARFDRFLFARLFHRDTLLVQGLAGKSALAQIIAQQWVRERKLESEFYAEYRAFWDNLYQALLENNPEGTDRFPGTRGRLVRLAQKILDRCLFVFFCEDMGGALGFPPQLLRDFLIYQSKDPYFDPNGTTIWEKLLSLFRAMNDGTAFGEKKRTDVDRLSARARRDIAMKVEIRRVFNENFQVYGVRKVWRQLQREGFDIARCTVARLMRAMGLQGIIRGKPIRTTVSDKTAPCPLDRVIRQFYAPAPNMLWLSEFTYVATWQGFVYVAVVIDAFARRIVGWRASRTAHAGFVLDALDQALHDRRPVHRGGLIHHSDRGSQYVSIRYSERLAEAGIEPSVGSVGDSYDNALAETVNGLYKAEVIHRRGPWRNFEAVEFATLEWVDWFNNRRLLEPIGNIPPAEAEERYYAMLDAPAVAA